MKTSNWEKGFWIGYWFGFASAIVTGCLIYLIWL